MMTETCRGIIIEGGDAEVGAVRAIEDVDENSDTIEAGSVNTVKLSWMKRALGLPRHTSWMRARKVLPILDILGRGPEPCISVSGRD